MKVYYVCDVMCGWCYGFHNTIDSLYKEFNKTIPFEMVLGDLYAGEYGVQLTPEKVKVLEDNITEIEKTTGVKFGEGFVKNILEKPGYEMNSEPASLAILAVKKVSPQLEFKLYCALQEAFFGHGQDITNFDVILKVWESLGLAKHDLFEYWNNKESKDEYKAEQEKIKELKVDIYPSLVLEEKGTFYLLSSGFESYETLRLDLDKMANKITFKEGREDNK